MIKQVTRYVTSDGMMFDSQIEAVEYEGRSEIFKAFDECILHLIYNEAIHPKTFSTALWSRLEARGLQISLTKGLDL